MSAAVKVPFVCLYLQQRNKPKEPPKAPRAAPFFLPTKPGLDLSFVPAPEDIPASEVRERKERGLDQSLSPPA